jgi:hypothetical protein
MASSARIFFAGVGTTFLILGVGFGGGVMMADSAFKNSTTSQAQARIESPVRVILPTTQAAQPPQSEVQPQSQQVTAVAAAPLVPVTQPLKELGTRTESVDVRKEVAEERRRHAERRAKRQAERTRRQQQVQPSQAATVMAFGREEPQRGLGFFGN